MARYWFNSLLPNSIIGIIASSATLWMILFLLFLFGLQASTESEDTESALGSSLFFSSIIVYMIVFGAVVIRRTQSVISEMALDWDQEEKESVVASLALAPTAMIVGMIGFCILGGFAHNMVMQQTIGGFFTAISSTIIAFTGFVGGMMVWMVIPFVIIALYRNAVIVGKLGEERIEIDLLNPDGMRQLGQLALVPVLGIAGSQFLYPLLWIGGNFNWLAFIPGFAITAISIAGLFVRALWPVRRRIIETKRATIQSLNRQIEEVKRQSEVDWPRLTALITHREYIQGCSNWPFDTSTMLKPVVYLLIPPLTWVGAALVENLISGM